MSVLWLFFWDPSKSELHHMPFRGLRLGGAVAGIIRVLTCACGNMWTYIQSIHIDDRDR